MSKIDDYFAQFEEHGQIRWSEDEDERDELVTALLGAEIVSSLDGWIRFAADLITNPKSSKDFRRESAAWKQDKFYRDIFADLSLEQKQAILALVCRAASGAVFSTLIALDQFPKSQLEITVINEKTGEKLATILPNDIDLHDRLFDWLEDFSESPEKYKGAF